MNAPHLNDDAATPISLTKRELETLPHLVNGKSNEEIAKILGISRRTAEKHVAAIIKKSGAENRKMLIANARITESGNSKP